ncbi:hypothetical protein AVEN_100508-1 [Araneus ventricosus]|uniref:Uncharacterized protein n=1 Tax=Araneus ventricosus TaxID=182803 RepID=A0A4Y2TWW6_ARAVE|nr:hypothetical protein AVEN_100508-1 [Araneus ventricosus]
MFTLPALLYLKLLPLFGQCLYHLIVPNKSRPPHAGGALPAGRLPALHPFWVGRASVVKSEVFMKWFKKKIWQLCCITFDDDDDVCAPPYGEDLTFNSDDCGKKPMIPGLHKEMNKKDYVLEWLMSCQKDWPDFGK